MREKIYKKIKGEEIAKREWEQMREKIIQPFPMININKNTMLEVW